MVARLPRVVLVRLATRMADMLRTIAVEDVALMKEELRRTVGNVDVDAIVRQAWQLRMLNELEVLSYSHLNQSNVDSLVKIVGVRHLDAARQNNKGVLLMISHFGANQLVMPALGYNGYSINQLSASPTVWTQIRTDKRNNRVWERVQRHRWALEQQLPAKHIDVFGFMRPAFRCLEKNEVLAIAFDGGGGSGWVPVPLGKRTAWVSTQPWQLARSTQAAVVPAVVVRQPHELVHRVVLDRPFVVDKSADRQADIERAAAAHGRWFSAWVQRFPAHYLPFLLLRRRVRQSDSRPFFDDYQRT
ncbi:MAG: hypothetical protein HN348_33080 [Proteobacteria bacterium]|nr:hypothetical protein [Pseudomonadota bacterium]